MVFWNKSLVSKASIWCQKFTGSQPLSSSLNELLNKNSQETLMFQCCCVSLHKYINNLNYCKIEYTPAAHIELNTLLALCYGWEWLFWQIIPLPEPANVVMHGLQTLCSSSTLSMFVSAAQSHIAQWPFLDVFVNYPIDSIHP